MEITPATFAMLLTASGAAIGAAIIQQVIDFLKSMGLTFVSGREKLIAFISAVAIVGVAAFVGLSEVPPRYSTENTVDIVIFFAGMLLAVYNIGRLAMAIHDDKTNRDTNSVRNVAGWKPNTGE